MVISHKYRFIFIKTRKTAGSSVEVYLSQHCADGDIFTPLEPPVEPHRPRNYRGIWNPFREYAMIGGSSPKRIIGALIRRKKFYNHIPALKVRGRVSADIWRNYFKFCIERNPWDKTISHYAMLKHRAGGNLTVDEYFEQGNFCHNLPLYTDNHGSVIVDRVIKYETLSDELAEVFVSLKIPFDGTLGSRAKSNYRKSQVIDEELLGRRRGEIRNIFKKEIEMHGYQTLEEASS